MKKIIITIIVLILLIVTLIATLFIIKNIEENKNHADNSILFDDKGNILNDPSRCDEITEIINDINIQGVVELVNKGYIELFNGQHFGELGFEMKEYTRATIIDKNQECIDYLRLTKHDTSYIENGDILICSGDLKKKGYSMWYNDFDTKNNSIIVLKANDYKNMKLALLKRKGSYYPIVKIRNFDSDSGYIYLEYPLVDCTNSDAGYNFPFVLKASIDSDTIIKGNLERDKSAKVEFKNINDSLEDLQLKIIEIKN